MSALRELRRRLAPAVVDMARRGETALANETMFEDVAYYRDSARFEAERIKLFRETPVVACLSHDLPGPGSYRTFDDTGVRILLTRGKDGAVRAFLNVCPHRAARVVPVGCGKANRFTCRFHAWTFDSAGRNIGLPEEHWFGEEVAAQKHLIPCPTEERHGLVFVLATPGGTMDLDAHLGAFGAELDILNLGNAEQVHGEDIPVHANWKYGMDTFFETYHLNALHRETFKGFFSPVCVFETFGRHHRFTFAPLTLDEWTRTPEAEWDIDLLPLQYFIFPNTIMAVGSTSKEGAVINIHRIFPESADFFVSRMAYCAAGGITSEAQRAEIDKAYEVARKAIVEDDYAVTGEGHAGLCQLPEGTKLPIGRQEIGVQTFHRNVREATA